MASPPRDDRVYRFTRLLAIFIIPFLIVAAIILYLLFDRTGELFAWPIKPPMTAMMLGAAYLGGVYFFARVALAQQWHTIKVGFPPVMLFAALLGVATLLHWDRFTHDHISFFTWTTLYLTTPFLVFGMWWFNRRTDPHTPAAAEVIVPIRLRWLLGFVGTLALIISLLLFLVPQAMLAVWPWTLTPLTARRRSNVRAAGISGAGHRARSAVERRTHHLAGASLFDRVDLDCDVARLERRKV